MRMKSLPKFGIKIIICYEDREWGEDIFFDLLELHDSEVYNVITSQLDISLFIFSPLYLILNKHNLFHNILYKINCVYVYFILIITLL